MSVEIDTKYSVSQDTTPWDLFMSLVESNLLQKQIRYFKTITKRLVDNKIGLSALVLSNTFQTYNWEFDFRNFKMEAFAEKRERLNFFHLVVKN